MRNNHYSVSLKISCIFLVAIYTSLLIINFLTPLMGEDYVLTVFPEQWPDISNCQIAISLWQRIVHQMYDWNIRIGEQLSIIFSCADKILFDICNSLVAMIYIWLIYQYAFKRSFWLDPYGYLYFVGTYCLILLFQPALGEVFFWRTGATNYLWSICLLLCFALPLRYYIGFNSKDIIGSSTQKTALLTIIGFFAGITNENTVVTIMVLYFIVIAYSKFTRRKLPVWIYTTAFSLLVGFLYMYNAHSTKVRIAYYNELYQVGDVTINTYLGRAPNVIRMFIENNFPLIILTLLALCIYYVLYVWAHIKQTGFKYVLLEARHDNLMILLLSSLSCAALVMSPYVEIRAFLLPDFLMLVCILYYTRVIVETFRTSKVQIIIISILLVVFTAWGWKQTYQVYMNYNDFAEKRIYALKSHGKETSFLWGEPNIPYQSRILTTREDYLRGQEENLSWYFGRDINTWDGYLWDFDPQGIVVPAQGNIDYVTYDSSNDALSIYGWACFEDAQINTKNNKIYSYLEIGEQRYYFKTQPIERTDIQDLYQNINYTKSGFLCYIEGIQKNLPFTEDSVKVGICLTDETQEYFNETILEKTYTVFQ